MWCAHVLCRCNAINSSFLDVKRWLQISVGISTNFKQNLDQFDREYDGGLFHLPPPLSSVRDGITHSFSFSFHDAFALSLRASPPPQKKKNVGPCVMLASPGMLQSGLSRQVFERCGSMLANLGTGWCTLMPAHVSECTHASCLGWTCVCVCVCVPVCEFVCVCVCVCVCLDPSTAPLNTLTHARAQKIFKHPSKQASKQSNLWRI